MKGSALVDLMSPTLMTYYARLCGWTLARAHCRSGDPVAIAEYLGDTDAFDRAIVQLREAVRGAERARLRRAAARGRLRPAPGRHGDVTQASTSSRAVKVVRGRNVARRAARRKVASAAGPTTRMTTRFVTARPVSQPSDVVASKTQVAVPLLEERRARQVRDGAARVGGERPERQVQQEAEQVAGHGARRRPASPSRPDRAAGGQQPGEHADPGAAEHLVRHPRADPAGQQRRGEQRRAAEGEAEAGPEHPTGQDEQ